MKYPKDIKKKGYDTIINEIQSLKKETWLP